MKESPFVALRIAQDRKRILEFQVCRVLSPEDLAYTFETLIPNCLFPLPLPLPFDLAEEIYKAGNFAFKLPISQDIIIMCLFDPRCIVSLNLQFMDPDDPNSLPKWSSETIDGLLENGKPLFELIKPYLPSELFAFVETNESENSAKMAECAKFLTQITNDPNSYKFEILEETNIFARFKNGGDIMFDYRQKRIHVYGKEEDAPYRSYPFDRFILTAIKRLLK